MELPLGREAQPRAGDLEHRRHVRQEPWIFFASEGQAAFLRTLPGEENPRGRGASRYSGHVGIQVKTQPPVQACQPQRPPQCEAGQGWACSRVGPEP